MMALLRSTETRLVGNTAVAAVAMKAVLVRRDHLELASGAGAMGLFRSMFARGTEDSALLRTVNKIETQLTDKGFIADEKLLPIQRSKLEKALADEMAKPTFRKASLDYQRRIVRGYWSLPRFQKNVDTGLRSIFRRESPNFADFEHFNKLCSAEGELEKKARQDRWIAQKHLQEGGLWELVPEDERRIWPR